MPNPFVNQSPEPRSILVDAKVSESPLFYELLRQVTKLTARVQALEAYVQSRVPETAQPVRCEAIRPEGKQCSYLSGHNGSHWSGDDYQAWRDEPVAIFHPKRFDEPARVPACGVPGCMLTFKHTHGPNGNICQLGFDPAVENRSVMEESLQTGTVPMSMVDELYDGKAVQGKIVGVPNLCASVCRSAIGDRHTCCYPAGHKGRHGSKGGIVWANNVPVDPNPHSDLPHGNPNNIVSVNGEFMWPDGTPVSSQTLRMLTGFDPAEEQIEADPPSQKGNSEPSVNPRTPDPEDAEKAAEYDFFNKTNH
jgi:hypothetical protein